MKIRLVYVHEIGGCEVVGGLGGSPARSSRVIRIFKSESAAMRAENPYSYDLVLMRYENAVASIRRQLFFRSHGYCEICGALVLYSSGHMHEQIHRGQGGDISLENSIFICPKCHAREHDDRNPRFYTSGIKDGETVCMHGARPFDCRMCMIRERG